MKLEQIVGIIESFAPLAYQENYDNAGLLTGDHTMEITGVLLCLDITPAVMEEALQKGVNLIISHHPVVFNPLKKLTGGSPAERIVIEAIRKNIALYSAHTNLDNIFNGVNHRIAEKLNLQDLRVLHPMPDHLRKLVTFVPVAHAGKVREALFRAGAGQIGNYASCSYNVDGTGTFKPLEGTHPFSGEVGKLQFESEVRIETVFPLEIEAAVVTALLDVHPYEEVAYDIYPLKNRFQTAGSGITGLLPEPTDETTFLRFVKETFKTESLRHTALLNKPVSRVAVCGGSGAFLIPMAKSSGVDIFITGEVKYHQFFDADGKIVIVDIGHYESEQFTIELFYDILIKNLPNFAIHFSSINTSPIYYL